MGRQSDTERTKHLQDAIEQETLAAGETYSAEELSRILGWNPSTTKRLLPLLVQAQKLGAELEWEEKQTGKRKNYFFRFKKE